MRSTGRSSNPNDGTSEGEQFDWRWIAARKDPAQSPEVHRSICSSFMAGLGFQRQRLF